MLNFLISLVRTGLPALWGGLVAWLSARGLAADVVATVSDPALVAALVAGGLAVVTTAVYAVVRVVEMHLPKFLAKFLPAEVVDAVSKTVLVVLLGVPRAPEYAPGTAAK
ncbi:hypothetical protein [Lentzea sp. NBRC 102530]|uniref:hypothetical protein n=1 Tax=Lentzea sp. NBRC 102530 TaxID=3032201 RepID=UPI0024A32098|nr:hypothetical protein [Lentzea sp. NBRC 102530]GLY55179.1 hypothetical protein Lesp01_88340 [Lentzea sp. NBRC 102530]